MITSKYIPYIYWSTPYALYGYTFLLPVNFGGEIGGVFDILMYKYVQISGGNSD
jgi:hypothetical protein